MNKIKVCIVGCGRIFPCHALSIKQIDYIDLLAVCDIKKDRADLNASLYHCKAYYDYKEMIDIEKPDAIHICLPHYLHHEVTLYALNHKVNVLTEKPMTIKYQDAIDCINAAKENNVKYGVVFQSRYNDATIFVKKALKENKLGKIISARSILTWYRPDSYYKESDWKGTWDKEGGGVIIDQAIHSIDLVNYLIDDEVIEIKVNMDNFNHKVVNVEDSAQGIITYKNNVKYCFYCTNNYGYDEPIEIKIYCELGKVTLSYEKATIEYNNGTIESCKQHLTEIVYEGAKDYWGNQHITLIKRFYECLKNNEPLDIDGIEALKTQEIICKIYENKN